MVNPFGVWGNTAGVLYITDTGNNRVRRVATNGIITTIAELEIQPLMIILYLQSRLTSITLIIVKGILSGSFISLIMLIIECE